MAQDACGREVQNICIVRGDTPTITFTAVDSAGDPEDLSSYSSVTGKLSVNSDSAPEDEDDQLIQIDATVTAATGLFEFELTTVDTTQVPDTYFYDIQINLDGAIKTVATGQWVIEADITDPNE